MPPGNQLTHLIQAELDAKAHDLREAARYLEMHLERMGSTKGLPIVIDSNGLLECQRLDNVDWTAEVKEQARVIVPFRVMEEIDAMKHSDSERLRDKAHRLLSWIDTHFSASEPGPVPLRAGATIELLLAERP